MTRLTLGLIPLAALLTGVALSSFDAWSRQWMSSDLAARDFALSGWLWAAVFGFIGFVALVAAGLVFGGRR